MTEGRGERPEGRVSPRLSFCCVCCVCLTLPLSFITLLSAPHVRVSNDALVFDLANVCRCVRPLRLPLVPLVLLPSRLVERLHIQQQPLRAQEPRLLRTAVATVGAGGAIDGKRALPSQLLHLLAGRQQVCVVTRGVM